MVASDDAAPEVGLKRLHEPRTACVLHDGELRKYLVAGFRLGMLVDPNVKAAFTVHEACHPFGLELHRPTPDVWSLRVLAAVASLPCGLSPCPADCYCRS